MIDAAIRSLNQIFSKPFRSVLWKAAGLTLVLVAAIMVGAQSLLAAFVVLPFGWMETAVSVLSGLGLLFGLAFVIGPATALFAGLFSDEIAELVESQSYPGDQAGQAQSILSGLATTLKFFVVIVGVNLVALPLVLVLGFGAVIFFIANGYLLGREYFQTVALRFHDEPTVRAMRLRNGARIFASGLVVSTFMVVPVLNILTPLFATTFMVHRYKRIMALESRAGGLLAAA